MPSIPSDQIDILIKLEKIDSRAARLKLTLDGVEKKLSDLSARLNEVTGSLGEKEAALKEMQIKYRSCESEIQTNNARLKKSRGYLKTVQNNKEFQVLLKEIDETEKKNSVLEDEMIQLLEKIEQEKKSIAEEKVMLVQLESQITNEKEDIEARCREERSELAELNEKRELIEKEIKPYYSKRYNRILERTGGPGIVRLCSAVCAACHINIPPQFYIEIQKGGSDYCPQCQRMIYWKKPDDAENDNGENKESEGGNGVDGGKSGKAGRARNTAIEVSASN